MLLMKILEKLGQGGWTVVRDPHYMVPYAYKNRQWIGYDDEQSLTLKTYYLLSKGLGGAMLWSIETDDFSARFHEETYVLTRTIYMLLNGVPPTPGPSLPPIETTVRPFSYFIIPNSKSKSILGRHEKLVSQSVKKQ